MSLGDIERRLLDTIRDRRERLGWTREDMSEHLEKVGVSISGATWAKVEYGGRKLKTEELYAVAELLDINLDDARPSRRLAPTQAVERLALDQFDELSREVRQFTRALTRAKSHKQIAHSVHTAVNNTDADLTVTINKMRLAYFIEDMLNDLRYPLDDWLRALKVDEKALEKFWDDIAAASTTKTEPLRILEAIDWMIDAIEDADNGVALEDEKVTRE